jgi:multidrug efflux pump
VVDLRNDGLANGQPAVLLALFRQPNANIIETVDRVRVLLPNLRAWEPRARNIMIGIPFDDL